VDVLVQLLQTEEREELATIQNILLEHIERFPDALLAIVERCQKLDPVQPPNQNTFETRAEQGFIKVLTLRFLQSDETIILLRRVLANDHPMCCFWGDMCKAYLQSSESNRLLILGIMARLPCPKSNIDSAAQFMGDLMGDLATICSRGDTRPAGVRLRALLPWFTRAAIISSNLRLPWYPNDLATCSDLLLHLVVSTVFAEKGLRALGKECVLQLAILSCTIASGAFILDAIQMSDLKRLDDLAQPLLITTARTPAMVEIREALSKTFVIDILTQSLLVALGNQDLKSSQNHQSLWLSLGGLTSVLSDKINSDPTAPLPPRIIARLTKLSSFLARQPPSSSSEDVVMQAKYNALHEINNALRAHWSARALSRIAPLHYDKRGGLGTPRQKAFYPVNRRSTKEDTYKPSENPHRAPPLIQRIERRRPSYPSPTYY